MESCSYLPMQKAGCSRIQECNSIFADPGSQHFYSSRGGTATDILTSSRVRIATKWSLARIRNPAKGSFSRVGIATIYMYICIYISRFRIATKYLSLPSQDYDYKEMESCSYLSMQKAGCSRIQECKSISADPGLQHLFYSSKGRTATDILTSSRVRIATKRSLARIRNPAKG